MLPKYEDFWHRELKSLCRRRGVRNSNASKEQMIERLYAFDLDPANLTHHNPHLRKLCKARRDEKSS